MKYLKKFENHSQYESYIATDYAKPNVSLCVQENHVHYNPIPQFFCRLRLQDNSIIEIEGSGELTSSMVDSYTSNTVSVEVGELCTSIGAYSFDFCQHLTSVVMSDSVTSIGMNAFNQSSAITSVTLSNNLTSISVGVFDWCTSLESVDVPDSVTNIMPTAFRHCESLTAATIGSGITTIGDYAFQTCRELTSLTIKATTPPTLANRGVFESSDNCIFYVPSASVDTYKTASGWSTYASRIQAIPTT